MLRLVTALVASLDGGGCVDPNGSPCAHASSPAGVLELYGASEGRA